MSPITILSVSGNSDVLLRRNDDLALAGFAVVSPKSPHQAPLLAVQKKVDALVVADSVRVAERRDLICAIREAHPGIPIIFVRTSASSAPEPLADVCVNGSTGSAALVEALECVRANNSRAER